MLSDITNILRDNGYKVTPQRLAIYDKLAHAKDHPNAEMLFNTLQPSHPTMSLATVYKTVDILAKLNLIKIINTGEESFRYDADTTEHVHVKCQSCQAVSDVHEVATKEMVAEVEERTGYQIQSKQIYLFGYCPECAKLSSNFFLQLARSSKYLLQ